MATFDEYGNRYEYIRLRREDGIVEMQLHARGGPLRWSAYPDKEVGDCLWEVGQDPENRCVVITGTGDAFCDAFDVDDVARSLEETGGGPQLLSGLYSQGYRLQMNHLAVEVPIVAAVNGPASLHAEVALLADVVICTPDTYFQDAPHFPGMLAPGDGVHVVWPALLGPNLGRYFLLSGMKLGAEEAWQRGVVAEIHPREALLERAWTIARAIVERPQAMVRAARQALVQKLRKEMLDLLPQGLQAEILAAVTSMKGGTRPPRSLNEPKDFSAGARRPPTPRHG